MKFPMEIASGCLQPVTRVLQDVSGQRRRPVNISSSHGMPGTTRLGHPSPTSVLRKSWCHYQPGAPSAAHPVAPVSGTLGTNQGVPKGKPKSPRDKGSGAWKSKLKAQKPYTPASPIGRQQLSMPPGSNLSATAPLTNSVGNGGIRSSVDTQKVLRPQREASTLASLVPRSVPALIEYLKSPPVLTETVSALLRYIQESDELSRPPGSNLTTTAPRTKSAGSGGLCLSEYTQNVLRPQREALAPASLVPTSVPSLAPGQYSTQIPLETSGGRHQFSTEDSENIRMQSMLNLTAIAPLANAAGAEALCSSKVTRNVQNSQREPSSDWAPSMDWLLDMETADIAACTSEWTRRFGSGANGSLLLEPSDLAHDRDWEKKLPVAQTSTQLPTWETSSGTFRTSTRCVEREAGKTNTMRTREGWSLSRF